MKIAIVGSRNFDNYNLMKDFVLERFDKDEIDLIISGGARGADRLAEKLADEIGVPKLVIKPEWEKYGKAAGFIRNEDIVKKSDVVFAFWDGQSRGTENSIKHAEKMDKKLFILTS